MEATITEAKVILKGTGFPRFSSTCTYIRVDNHNVLVDTGSIEFREQLIENLRGINLEPSDIDIVILTHMHIDHFSNLCIFINADIYTTMAELKSYEQVVSIKNRYSEDIAMNFVLNDLSWRSFNESGLIDGQKRNIYQSIESLAEDQYNRIVFMDEMVSLFGVLEFVRFYGHSKDPRGIRFNYKGKRIIICGDAVTNKRWFERVVVQHNVPNGIYDEIVRNVAIASEKSDVIIPGHGFPFFKDTQIYDRELCI